MAFNVKFRGLISHIEDAGEARAVLVNASGHDALMIIHVDDVTNLKGWPDNPIGVFHVLKISSELILDQAKIDLTIVPTRLGPFSHVPSLKTLLADKVDADAKKGKTSHPAVAASLRYGTGDLTTTQCFSVAAKWSGSPAGLPDCVAKEVLYVAQPDGPVKIRDAGSAQSVTVRESATVWITNSDKGKQFKELEKLGFLNSAKLMHEPTEDTAICVNCVKQAVAPSTTLECTNTGYP